jgi:O-antigen/teichoic acid export membrane protein
MPERELSAAAKPAPEAVLAAPARSLRAGATLATAAQILTAAVGGLTGIVVARLLGPQGTGAFNLLLSTLLLVSVFSTLGIETGITYHVSGGRWRTGDALRQAQLAALGMGLAGGGIGLVIAVATTGSAFQQVTIANAALTLAAVPLNLSWTFSAALALSLSRYEAYAVGMSAQGTLLLVLVAGLTPWLGLTGAVLALFGSNLVTAIGMVVWGRRSLPSPEPGWVGRAPAELRRASTFGVKAYLTNAMSYLNQRADLFILNASAAGATVGHYSIALSITAVGLLLPRALSSVVLPRVASLDADAGTQDRQAALAARSMRHAVLIMTATVGVMALGVLAIPLLYGSAFQAAVALSYILLPGIGLFGLANVLSATVVGKGHPQYSLYAALLVTPPTLGLYALLVPLLGAPGAALASTISYSATCVLMLHYFFRVTSGLALRSLLPGRAELHDYRALAASAIARWRRR